jgi:hypothetical protein
MTEASPKEMVFTKGTVIFSLTLMSLFLFRVCCSFAADAVPDLMGTWQCKSQAVVVGKLGHTEHSDKPVFTSVELTIRIDGQEGMLIYGVKESKKGSEEILGVIKPDNKSIYMTDLDGYYVGTLLSPDQMETVYLEAGTESRVAAYAVYKRVK